MPQRKIYITGFMGSGKSTIGKNLAQKLRCAFIDTDDELENQYQKEIWEMFADEGEKWFREREEEKINEISNRTEFAVISLGGGALISEKTLENIKSRGVLIYIQSSPENIYNRIKHSTRRPLLRSQGESLSREEYLSKIEHLLILREKGFMAADIIYNRDGQDASECAEKIRYLIK